MATKKKKPTKAELQLDAKLNDLQDCCTQELRMHYVTQQQERENLAQIYFWWQDASKIPDYYASKLTHLPQEQLRQTVGKINFAPVLRLFYGVTTLSDSKRSRMSSALNALNEEWEAKPKLYKQDVAKLANYIDQNSGVTGLAKQQAKIAPVASIAKTSNSNIQSRGAADIQTDIQLDEFEAQQVANNTSGGFDIDDSIARFAQRRKQLGRPEHVDITDGQRKSALSDEAQEYWRNANGIASFDLEFGIEANKRKYSLALVRVDGDKMAIINSTIDEEIIKAALLASYRTQYASVPKNLRCVLEVLRTQFVGEKVASQLDKVPELGIDKDETGQRFKIYKRMIFIPSTNKILFSPVSSKSSVVTVSTPVKTYLNVTSSDFYLSAGPMHYLNNRLLANDDVNQFTVNNVPRIMALHKTPSVIYTMKITNKAIPADFAYIDIVSFGVSEAKSKHLSQVALNDEYIAAIKHKFTVHAGILHKLAKQYADKWLESKGDHASRPENDLCTFAATANSFDFEIFDKDGNVGSNTSCVTGTSIAISAAYKYFFKCRDLMPALGGMGALQIVGDVEMLLDDNVIVFKYNTGVASYITAIPTYNIKSRKRNENAFTAYHPKSYLSHSDSPDVAAQVEGDDLIPVYCYA
jgi:hypothetical protein